MGFCFDIEEFGVHPAMSMETRSESFKIHIDHEYFPFTEGMANPWRYDQHIEIEYVDLPGLIRALQHVAEEHGIDLASRREVIHDPTAEIRDEMAQILAKMNTISDPNQQAELMKEWLILKGKLDKLEVAKVEE